MWIDGRKSYGRGIDGKRKERETHTRTGGRVRAKGTMTDARVFCFKTLSRWLFKDEEMVSL